MSKQDDWTVNVADWRTAHDAVGAMLKAAEDADEPEVARQKIYDGYIELAAKFRSGGGDGEVYYTDDEICRRWLEERDADDEICLRWLEQRDAQARDADDEMYVRWLEQRAAQARRVES